MITRPTYLDKIKPFINQHMIKILTGIRRGGKSTVLEMLRAYLVETGVPAEKIIHINFENYSYINVRTQTEFMALIDGILAGGGRHYLLFDEIQNIENWEIVINGLLAEKDVDIYLTGSNSRLLSSELSTFLTGRYVNIVVQPLSFQEFLDFAKIRGRLYSTTREAFDDYLGRGGFPLANVADYTLEQSDTIVNDIYNSILFYDLVARKNIRNTDLLSRVVKYIFDNIGNEFSGKSIIDYLKSEQRVLKPETVYNYLDWLEEVYVISRVPRYDIRGKALLKANEKIFLGDIGLLYAVNGRNVSRLPGILENVVYNELISHGYTVYVGKNSEREVDFIAEKSGDRLYLQVAMNLSSVDTIEREFRAFEGIADNYPKYVLTLDEIWTENRAGIKQKFLPDFLLEEL
ncbi:ATP-binding protein [Candidatus Saccharibacteria bacterium]|nr:ATP-binding protein [Candidatus Saccharibacteria bacterium]